MIIFEYFEASLIVAILMGIVLASVILVSVRTAIKKKANTKRYLTEAHNKMLDDLEVDLSSATIKKLTFDGAELRTISGGKFEKINPSDLTVKNGSFFDCQTKYLKDQTTTNNDK